MCKLVKKRFHHILLKNLPGGAPLTRVSQRSAKDFFDNLESIAIQRNTPPLYKFYPLYTIVSMSPEDIFQFNI